MTTPLTWHALITVWAMPTVVGVVIVGAALCYLWGVRRAGRWRIWRTVSFLAGLAVTALAVGSSVNAYGGVLFSMHMAQHLLLIAVAPALLVFGRPMALVAECVRGRTRRVLRGLARGRIAAVVLHPLVALAFYAAVVAGTHLTPFPQSMATSSTVHAVEELLYLASGYLLLSCVFGDRPVRRPLPPLMGLVVLLVGMAVDAIVGVVLMMTPTEPFAAYGAGSRSWGPSPVEDLHWAGAAMWVGGDVLMAVLAIIVLARWVYGADRGPDLGPWLQAARRSAVGMPRESTVDIDDDDDALDAYNAMLARLAAQDDDRKR